MKWHLRLLRQHPNPVQVYRQQMSTLLSQAAPMRSRCPESWSCSHLQWSCQHSCFSVMADCKTSTSFLDATCARKCAPGLHSQAGNTPRVRWQSESALRVIWSIGMPNVTVLHAVYTLPCNPKSTLIRHAQPEHGLTSRCSQESTSARFQQHQHGSWRKGTTCCSFKEENAKAQASKGRLSSRFAPN